MVPFELNMNDKYIYGEKLFIVHFDGCDISSANALDILHRASLFSKSSLARLQEFWNSSICLYEIIRKNMFKSTCPTGIFTCPGPWGSGKRLALLQSCAEPLIFILQLFMGQCPTHWPSVSFMYVCFCVLQVMWIKIFEFEFEFMRTKILNLNFKFYLV